MERQIVCFGIPRLAVALARLDDPTLCTRPVAVAFAHTSRAIIHEASPEAEEAGVTPGLQADQAQVCRQRRPAGRRSVPGVTSGGQAASWWLLSLSVVSLGGCPTDGQVQ